MRLPLPAREARPRLFLALSVFALFFYNMVWPVHFYLARSLHETYYVAFVPVLVAAALYFFRLRNGPEYRLLVFYWLWVWVSRLLNGDFALVNDFRFCFELSLILPFFLTGLVLEPKERRQFLVWMSAAVGVFYCVIGLLALYGYTQLRYIINPITGADFGGLIDFKEPRINLLDTNSNSSAHWYMMSFFLMLYQFFACRKKLWRIPIVFCAIVDYVVIAMTYTRSVKLPISLSLALLLVLWLLRYGKKVNKALRIAALVLVFAVSSVLLYKSYDPIVTAVARITVQNRQEKAEQLALAEDAITVYTVEDFGEFRQWDGSLDSYSNGRIEIYLSALDSLRQEPMRLLRGCLSKDVMYFFNRNYAPDSNSRVPNFHNYLLQAANFLGLPGFLLLAAVSLMLTVKALRFFFSDDERIRLGEKMLCLPVLSSFVYGLLDASLFTDCDYRPLFSYIFFGMFLGYYYDVFPRKEKKKA